LKEYIVINKEEKVPRVNTKPRIITVEMTEDYEFIPPEIENPISKEELIELYYDDLMSIADIASTLNRGETTIRRWMAKYELPRRSYSEATILYYKKMREKK
jgi:hypothetical protein